MNQIKRYASIAALVCAALLPPLALAEGIAADRGPADSGPAGSGPAGSGPAGSGPAGRALVLKDSAPGWRGWNTEGFPTGWLITDGVLSKKGSVDDLVSKEMFGNFELTVEWKIGKEGNSGIFYRATREYDHIYWSGPEYQLLDDANAPDGKNPLTAAASAYALYAAPAGVVRPYDHWNRTRILVNGNHVEHWLNGQKVVEYELLSSDWKAKVAASKFSAYPNYGLAPRGFIGIQGDHPGALAIRHMRIRVLP